jgi:hypothetical protein
MWIIGVREALESMQGDKGKETYFQTMLGVHVMERITGSVAHVKPWYAYLSMLPMMLLPATPLLVVLAFRKHRANWSREATCLIQFCTLWAALYFVLLSIPGGKRSVYLLPMLPPFAIYFAAVVRAAEGHRFAWAKAWAAILGLLAIAGGAVGGLMLLAPERAVEWGQKLVKNADGFDALILKDRLTASSPDLMAMSGLLIVTGLFALWSSQRRDGASALAAGGVVCVSALMGFSALLAPHPDPLISPQGVAEHALNQWERRGAEGPIYFFHHRDEAVPFYLRRPIIEVPSMRFLGPYKRLEPTDPLDRERSVAELLSALRIEGALAFASTRDLEQFGIRLNEDVWEVSRVQAGSKEFVLLEGLGR